MKYILLILLISACSKEVTIQKHKVSIPIEKTMYDSVFYLGWFGGEKNGKTFMGLMRKGVVEDFWKATFRHHEGIGDYPSDGLYLEGKDTCFVYSD